MPPRSSATTRYSSAHRRRESESQPIGRKAGARIDTRQPSATHDDVLRARGRSVRRVATRGIRDIGSPRDIIPVLVQRGARARHHAGDLPLPPAERHRWSAVHGNRHARAVGIGVRIRARGSRRQRGGSDDRRSRRLHSDAGGLARDSRLQPRAHQRARRRHRRDSVTQSAGGRRLQVRSAQRRTRGFVDHRLDTEQGE